MLWKINSCRFYSLITKCLIISKTMEGVGLPRYLKGKITLNSKRKPVYREQINNAKCTCKSFKKTDPIKKKEKKEIFFLIWVKRFRAILAANSDRRMRESDGEIQRSYFQVVAICALKKTNNSRQFLQKINLSHLTLPS